jgi:hypothetical protein
MSDTHTPKAHTLVVIPCAADKLPTAALAIDLYASSNFRHVLNSARVTAVADAEYFGHDTKVMILSARHGLVDLGQVIEPYDTKMGDAGCIGRDELVDQLVALAPQTVMSLLPSRYFDALHGAVRFVNEEGSDEDPYVELLDVYEAAPGIGFQRGVASSLVRAES